MQQATANRPTGPFELPPPQGAPLKTLLYATLKKPLGKLLCLDTLNAMYAHAQSRQDAPGAPADDVGDAGGFIARALCELGVGADVAGADLANIPATGPLVVVSNHPFGVVEGLVLAQILTQVRPDVKILANHLLSAIPEMRPLLIELDPFGGGGASRRNMAGLRAALAWLKKGGALVVFPAGEVASLAVGKRMVADPPWRAGVASLVRKSGAPVLPVFFHGRNSNWFQAAGLVHPRLRTLLLPRENLKQRGQALRLSMGGVVAPERLAGLSGEEASAYLRFRCHLLRARRPGDGTPRAGLPKRPSKAPLALAPQRPREARLREVQALPEDRVLAQSAPFRVFHVSEAEAPNLLHDVACLRESTFRLVGEGTGQPLDRDRYDSHYRHLILWNDADQEIAGAYRFAGTDEILSARGPAGMYSASQFRIRPGFWERLGPALELGRSFVRPRYQKSYQPLLLLWKGLAEYVARNPRYRTLFGCVSISGDYRPLSRELMMAFLLRHRMDQDLARLAKPRRRPGAGALARVDLRIPEAAFREFSDMDQLVAEIEDGRGVPVLLRQYLKLGGRIAAFNRDPDFGDCLDGLIVVDLAQTDQRTLARFMGSEQARGFRDFHAASTTGAAVCPS